MTMHQIQTINNPSLKKHRFHFLVDTIDLALTRESTIQGYSIALLVSACVNLTHITILFK